MDITVTPIEMTLTLLPQGVTQAALQDVQNSFNTTINGVSSTLQTEITSLSSSNLDVYTTVQANSAVQWNYQGSDIKALSGNWENSSTAVQVASANWTTAYTSLSTKDPVTVYSDTAPVSGELGTTWINTSSMSGFEWYGNTWVEI